MALFTRLTRWLNGEFICIKCGKRYNIMSFGYGMAICPNCYNGETEFLRFDEEYWLNRLLIRLHNNGSSHPKAPLNESMLPQKPEQLIS